MRHGSPRTKYDAGVVGSGPNGLAAAITLAQKGWRMLLVEGRDTLGDGMRSLPLTLPGFTHDVCSAIHRLALASPFFRQLDLAPYALQWVHPPAAVAHPRDGAGAATRKRPSPWRRNTRGQDSCLVGDGLDAARNLLPAAF